MIHLWKPIYLLSWMIEQTFAEETKHRFFRFLSDTEKASALDIFKADAFLFKSVDYTNSNLK